MFWMLSVEKANIGLSIYMCRCEVAVDIILDVGT